MAEEERPTAAGYDVGRRLGRGGSASVWLVQDQRTRQEYALKCFDAAGRPETGRADEDAIRREVRILSVLDHAHLVKARSVIRVNDFALATSGGQGEVQGPVGLLMDYAPGGSLAALLSARTQISVGETVTVLTPLAQALAYLHGKGFTHGDVSPGNVLFTAHGKPLLADLGVARMLGEPAADATSGTAGFVDPAPLDVVRAGLQPERDVYSLAALGWFCLTGTAPGRTRDRAPLPLLVPEVPVDLVTALEAGLNEDRRQRPTAAAFAVALFRSAAARPVDLAGSVHSSVVPQLLTRRQEPVPTRRAALIARWQDARRRLLTRQPPADAVPAHGRRASEVPKPKGRAASRYRGWAAGLRHITAILGGLTLVVAAACGWWLWGPKPVTPGQQSGSVPAALSETVNGGESATAESTELARVKAAAASADPVLAVSGLSALRDGALRKGNPELLAEVNVAGSAAAAADDAFMARLVASGQRLDGFTSSISDAFLVGAATDARAVVAVTAATSDYREVDASGAVLSSAPERGSQRLHVVLLAVDGYWRVSEILPVTG
ncbi:Serine/threonine-protein kinase PrkC [Arthrobacter ulcerisalmonis]|uniref:non-specific serine/threonine protein kinase n=1 Tax=Arthrobacter ulcerisalmonis TaxID=2483813 RepID=A0A3P5XDF4_9MICC|nr:serine/threonine-protein kinase [Arthrobacter ulcerisalmonis]VDC32894.1 Serine/threonine-protein kinase PrkC [Arthrobacter ulcerisalmonis]